MPRAKGFYYCSNKTCPQRHQCFRFAGKYRPDKPKTFTCTFVRPKKIGDCDFFLPLNYAVKKMNRGELL